MFSESTVHLQGDIESTSSEKAPTTFLKPLSPLVFFYVHFLFLFSFLLLPLYPLAPGFSSSLLLHFLNPSTSEGGSHPVFLINQKSLALTTRKASKNAELFGSMHFIIIELPACRVDLVLQFSVEIPSKCLPRPPEILCYTQRHGRNTPEKLPNSSKASIKPPY